MTETLFGFSKPKSNEQLEQEKQERKEKKIKEMLAKIVDEDSLWDMRCWDKHKDREEINKWLDKCEPNNCGHAVYCIEELLKMGVSREQIIQAMLKNPYIHYAKRLVKCFEDDNLCPHSHKDCSERPCDDCDRDSKWRKEKKKNWVV